MDGGILLVRLLHILLGVFWAGTILFFATLLEPSVREAGPGGAGVMKALIRRGYMTIMPVVALLTILTGTDLMRRASANFQREWFASAPGQAITLGALCSLLALLLGVLVVRPGVVRIGALMQQVGAAPGGPETATQQAEIERLKARNTGTVRVIAVLLAVTVATMAVARYLG